MQAVLRRQEGAQGWRELDEGTAVENKLEDPASLGAGALDQKIFGRRDLVHNVSYGKLIRH